MVWFIISPFPVILCIHRSCSRGKSETCKTWSCPMVKSEFKKKKSREHKTGSHWACKEEVFNVKDTDTQKSLNSTLSTLDDLLLLFHSLKKKLSFWAHERKLSCLEKTQKNSNFLTISCRCSMKKNSGYSRVNTWLIIIMQICVRRKGSWISRSWIWFGPRTDVTIRSGRKACLAWIFKLHCEKGIKHMLSNHLWPLFWNRTEVNMCNHYPLIHMLFIKSSTHN